MTFPLAALPLLLVPYDSLTHLFGADLNTTSQTFPATAALSIPYLLVAGRRLRTSPQSRRLLRWLMVFATGLLAVTLLNIVSESVFSGEAHDEWRLATATRQGFSLALGLTTFVMFQDVLLRLGHAQAFKWLAIGGIPSLLLVLVQLLAGEPRVQGFSSEPSHLADVLVFAFLPACGYVAWPFRRRVALALVGTLALVVAFSSTGLMKATMVMLLYFASRNLLGRGLLVIAAVMAAVFAVLSFFPENYVFLIVSWMYTSYMDTGVFVGGSFIDRFNGFAGPVAMLGDWHAWFGYGLGGDTVYFDQLFDLDTADAIRDVKGDIASISSLQGKMLLYAGVWGYAIYLAAWLIAWRSAPPGSPSRFMVPALFFASVFSLAPLFLPHLWLWFAFATTPFLASRATFHRMRPTPSAAGVTA